MKLILPILLISMNTFAQAPQLYSVEQNGIKATIEKAKKASDDENEAYARLTAAIAEFKEEQANIAKIHPGYHLDEKTMQLTKDEVKK